MTQQLDRFFILAGNYGELSIIVDHVRRINQLAIHAARQRCLGQARADVFSNIDQNILSIPLNKKLIY